MTTCAELDGLLTERASGPLAPEDAARLEVHLASCRRCAEALLAYEETLELLRTGPLDSPGEMSLLGAGPAPSLAADRRALERLRARRRGGAGRAEPSGRSEQRELAVATLERWRDGRRRRLGAAVIGAGVSAAAALVLVVVSPRLRGGELAPRPPVELASTGGQRVPAAQGQGQGAEAAAEPAPWEPDVDGAMEAAALAAADGLGDENLLADAGLALAGYGGESY